jgi:hypothetical protein
MADVKTPNKAGWLRVCPILRIDRLRSALDD